MIEIDYVDLRSLNQEELKNILNKGKVREHLVSHEDFDKRNLIAWIDEKIEMDARLGCKVRGIKVNGKAAGWCGIQFEAGTYELALVLDDEFWGIGTVVFKELMLWASEGGLNSVVLHLFHTRPKYRFLKNMAIRVYQSMIFGQKFTTYELKVPDARQQ